MSKATRGLVHVYTGDGKGKCVSADAYIFTASGLRQAADLATAAQAMRPRQFTPALLEVVSPLGNSVSTAIYNGGATDTVQLTTRFGYRLEGTPEHPVLSLSSEGPVWRSLLELQTGDYVAVARGQAAFGTTRRPLDKAYLTGLLIGDGHIRAQKRAWRLVLSSSDATCVQAWRSYLRSLDIEPVTRVSRPLDYRVDRKAPVQHIMEDLWLSPGRAESKAIDPRWLRCDSETLRALLQGLFDSDGSAGSLRGDVEFCTTSDELAQQVHLLLLSFGIIGRLYRRQTKSQNGRGLPSWRLQLRGAEARKVYERIGFRLHRKQERSQHLASKHNPNVDVIPHTWELLCHLPLSEAPAPRTSHKGPQPRYACQFMRRARIYRETGAFASYEKFSALLAHPAVVPSPEATALRNLVSMNCFWDRVKCLAPGQAQVYDFCVPDTQVFVANGIVCHNTTAALGLALRAAGHGWRTYIGQFMKGSPTGSRADYGELEAANMLGADELGRPRLTIERFGKSTFIHISAEETRYATVPQSLREAYASTFHGTCSATPEDARMAQEGLAAVRRAMLSGEYEIVVMDEINVTLYFKLLTVQDVLEVIDEKPPGVELVLTGRRVPEEILVRADYVTEMREVKHPYQEGIQARKGVEY